MPNFKEGQHFEECLLQALLLDHAYAEQMVEVLKPEYFTQSYLKAITQCFFRIYNERKSFVSVDTLAGILATDIVDQKICQNIDSFFAGMRAQEAPSVSDLDVIKARSLEFCRKQNILAAMSRCLDCIDRMNLDEIVSIMQSAVAAGSERDLGHIYEECLDDRMNEELRQPIATPWPPLNKIINGGVSAGELAVILALTGVGKSHALVDIGAAAALAGKNVIHFTFELGEIKVGKRYDARISGIAYDDLKYNEFHVAECINSLAGAIRIKKYPNRKATVQTIRSYLAKLKMENIVPDIIIVDYADLMKSSKQYENKRFEEEAVYEELRDLADELGVPIWTASQTNRSGMDVEVLTLKHIAECFAKANTSDLFITMNRKKTGDYETLGNFFVAKSRLGADGLRFNVLVNTALSKIECLEPGSPEERQAMMEHDMQLESDATRIKKTIDNLRARADKGDDNNIISFPHPTKSIHQTKEPTSHD